MNKFKRMFSVYMAEAGDGAAAGGGAATVEIVPAAVDPATAAATPAASAPAAAVVPVVPAIAGDGKPAAGQSALAQGGAAEVVPASIPEKYQVKKADGTIDTEASSLKLAEAYVNLEKRLGSGDAPPKTVEEYTIAVPDNLKEAWKPAEDPLLQKFLTDAHAAGMNQKQVDLVMAKYMEIAPELVSAGHALDAEACTTALKAEWKTDEQYKANVKQAYKAAVGYFGADVDSMVAEYGNDPRFIKGLAKLGAEMGEDRSVNFESNIGQGDITSLLTSEAYTNAKHADHVKVSAQVKSHFDKLAAAQEKGGHSLVM